MQNNYALKLIKKITGEMSESVGASFLGGILSTSIVSSLYAFWDSILIKDKIILLCCLLLVILLFIQRTALRKFNDQVVFGVGIKKIMMGANIPDVHQYEISEDSNFIFLGISGKYIVNNLTFINKLKIINQNRCTIKFLLLNPYGKFIKERARDESEDCNIWSDNIKLITKELYKLNDNMSQPKIEVRYYDIYPIWRLLSSMKKHMYVSYFPPTSRGKESPHLMVANNEPDDIYNAFMRYFDEIWQNYSKDAAQILSQQRP